MYNGIMPGNLKMHLKDYCEGCKMFDPRIEGCWMDDFHGKDYKLHEMVCAHAAACDRMDERGKENAGIS